MAGFLDFLPIVGKVIDKLIPDPAAKAEMQLKLATLAQAGEFKELDAQVQLLQGQIDVNKIEAASEDRFKSGWRPFVGWICGVGLGVQFIVAPFATWTATLYGHAIAFPSLDMGTLLTLLGGMLGLGAMRSFDKKAGTA